MLQNARYQQALGGDQANVFHPFGRSGLDITTRHRSQAEPWLSEVTAKVGRQLLFHSGLLLLIPQKIPEGPAELLFTLSGFSLLEWDKPHS